MNLTPHLQNAEKKANVIRLNCSLIFKIDVNFAIKFATKVQICLCKFSTNCNVSGIFALVANLQLVANLIANLIANWNLLLNLLSITPIPNLPIPNFLIYS
jgi:hypothetical protein